MEYKTYKKVQLILGLVLACGVGFSIGWSLCLQNNNDRFKEYHNDIADELLVDCEEDGLKDCNIEWVYDGKQIMSVKAVGTKGE